MKTQPHYRHEYVVNVDPFNGSLCNYQNTRLHFKAMKSIRAACLFSLLSLCSGQAYASELRLFADDTVLNAVLSAPLTQVYAQKKEDVRLYMPGSLSFLAADGSKQRLELSIKTRGVFRRANCRLPPLLLNFKKKSVANTLFASQDKLKLVSPCSPTKNNQQRLIMEYLAYQAFEVVTDISLKTRLVRMSYVDSDNKKKPWTHLTFVIEDEKELAQRHGVSAIHRPKLQAGQLSDSQATLVELFQFMIGNTDFSLTRVPGSKNCCHNMQILGARDATTDLWPVPYDFDSAGLVDADYAAPSVKLPIKDVKKRLFRGRCRSAEVLAESIEKFKHHQQDIIGLFADSVHLNDRFRKKSVNYLNQFFDIVHNPKRVESEISNRCRG